MVLTPKSKGDAMPMQPQEKPRGHAMAMCKAILYTIARENKKRKMRVGVPAILRAVEWTRYCITETFLGQLEQAAASTGATSFTPVNARVSTKKGKRHGGRGDKRGDKEFS